DGNGRWAVKRGLPRHEGHVAGLAAMLATLAAAPSLGISWITFFAFSTENWSRPAAEVAALMDLNARALKDNTSAFVRDGVRVRYTGLADPRIPVAVRDEIRHVEQATEAGRRLTVTVAFNHGGRSEMVDACRAMMRDGIDPERLT
nr:polyprenyl diphosphate synthase [Micromonospora sp. DSM 115978]